MVGKHRFPEDVEWRELLDKYTPSTVKRMKGALKQRFREENLGEVCLFTNKWPHNRFWSWERPKYCYMCRAVFPDLPEQECPCEYYSTRRVFRFAKQVAEELGLLDEK